MTRPAGAEARWLARCAFGLVVATMLLTARAGAQPALPSSGDPIDQAQALFDAGQYAEGRSLLVESAAHAQRDPLLRARLLLALGAFYERYVGDYRRLESTLRDVEGLPLPDGSPERLAVAAAHARLRTLASDYADENAVLTRAASGERDRAALQQRVTELTELIARRPDYPRLATAYHYLGQCQLALGSYRLAYRAFSQALALRPAIAFGLPTPHLRAAALARWIRHDVSRASWGVLAALLGITGVALGRSKPWRWLGLRHALALGVLLLAWPGCFALLVRLLRAAVPSSPATFPAPVVLQTELTTPLAAPAGALFGYGVVALVGAFVMAALASRLRLRWSAAALTGSGCLLLCASLMVQFVLEQRPGTFQPADGARHPYLEGAFLYGLPAGQAPFVLTDPLRYCAFQASLDELDEPEVQRWFRSYRARCLAP